MVSGADLAFSATFGPLAPEPGSWALMIGGFGVVGAALRRRQRGSGTAGAGMRAST